MGLRILGGLLLTLLVVLALMSGRTTRAQGIPPGPVIYIGNVIVSGAPAPDGLQITARILDYETAPVTTSEGGYIGLTVAPPDESYVGKTITFHMDGVQAAETDTSIQPSLPIVKRGFTLTFATLPPTPTPTPTATPFPPTVYSGTIVVAGGEVPADAILIARVGSYVSPPAKVEGNNYRNLVVTPIDPTAIEGLAVEFFLNGVRSSTTDTFAPGVFKTGFGLVFSGLPTPTPTPLPTPTPTATPIPTPTPVILKSVVYSGSIVVGGSETPDRAVLVARVGSYQSPPAVVEGDNYRNLVLAPADLSVIGMKVEFYLNGILSDTTDVYENGKIKSNFGLIFVGLPTPTPTPTPTPSPTPTPGVLQPSAYSGSIVMPGVDIPARAVLVARVGSYESPPAVVDGVNYHTLVLAPTDPSVVRMRVEFYLNGVLSSTTDVFESGRVKANFGLIFVGFPTPIPSPTVTVTPTPTPESGGGLSCSSPLNANSNGSGMADLLLILMPVALIGAYRWWRN